MRRLSWGVVKWTIAGLLGAVALVYGVTVWNAGNDLHARLFTPNGDPAPASIAVEDVDADRVTLQRTAASQIDGSYGLRWDDGYGRVGNVRDIGDDLVVRDFTPFEGVLVPGDLVALDEYAYPPDPVAAHGLLPADVEILSEGGAYPAWLFPGDRDTWAIFVHGRGSQQRAQVHRVLPTLVDHGLPVLVVTYRNDAGAPPDSDGRVHWGQREWVEIEAAARFAISSGAEEFVLIGYGLGGSMAAMFLRESPVAARAAGLILDSAVLNLSAVADADARSRGVAAIVSEPAKTLAAFRFNVQWSELNHTAHAAEFDVPILMFHGTADDVAPVETADAFAAVRPDLVTYERVTGAGHQAVWNWDPSRYEAALDEFLTGLLGPVPEGDG